MLTPVTPAATSTPANQRIAQKLVADPEMLPTPTWVLKLHWLNILWLIRISLQETDVNLYVLL